MKYIKEELEKLIFEENLPYEEIGRRYNVSGTYIKKIAGKLGISLQVRKKFPEGYKPANTGKGKPTPLCENCGAECDIYSTKYCSNSCQQERRQKDLYKDFLENNDKYSREGYNPVSFKKHFLQEQEGKCAICGMENSWNGRSIVFIMDHIDGNAFNNKRNNLRLVCPNCDSQLDTFKSKNKNSARKERYLLNYKNTLE